MSKFLQFDDDKYRLPEGFKRVAYDADTQRYTFRSPEGELWEGEPGEEFGNMTLAKLRGTEYTRPLAFENEDSQLSATEPSNLKSFNEFLPRSAFAPPRAPATPSESSLKRSTTSDKKKKPESAPAVSGIKRSLTGGKKAMLRSVARFASTRLKEMEKETEESDSDEKDSVLEKESFYGDEKSILEEKGNLAERLPSVPHVKTKSEKTAMLA
ncbi:hypothetical protein DL96DRAFT_1812327 [Flagelloscypha sp. PMI_526]|nr:hypothetical protein DL96DRAFT_1812327 [Flagelloscypha sp. PMI_526]